MTDESRPPFILPDSVLKRRRGLLAGATSHRWAEHLELLSAEGIISSAGDLMALMQNELERLHQRIDPADEPDRHAETILAAAAASFLDERLTSEQRDNCKEVYFSIVLGYLYGRLTKPGKKSEDEATEHYFLARELSNRENRRKRGPQSLEQQREKGRAWMRAEAAKLWEQDHIKALRIGEVVHIIRSKVSAEVQMRKEQGDEQPWKCWPRGEEAIRKIIREVAPDYATKPGAPKRI